MRLPFRASAATPGARRHDGRRVRAGFSLLEAIIALVVVVMVSIYALNAIGVGFDNAYRSRRAIEMDALLNQRLDYLNMMQASSFTGLPDSLASGAFDYPNNEYAWQMTSIPYTDQPGVFDVTISVIFLPDVNTRFTVHTLVYRRTAVNSVTGGSP